MNPLLDNGIFRCLYIIIFKLQTQNIDIKSVMLCANELDDEYNIYAYGDTKWTSCANLYACTHVFIVFRNIIVGVQLRKD